MDAQMREEIRKLVAREVQDVLRAEVANWRAQMTSPAAGTAAGTGAGAQNAGAGRARYVRPRPVGQQRWIGPTTAPPGQEGAAAGGQQAIGQPLTETAISEQQQVDYVQSIAHTLAQAQFELSQELALNLQRLKNVISESQDLARKIEAILGHKPG
ncbi:MAG TPA: hypothetical protein VF234_10865 [Limnochordia bacterium]